LIANPCKPSVKQGKGALAKPAEIRAVAGMGFLGPGSPSLSLLLGCESVGNGEE